MCVSCQQGVGQNRSVMVAETWFGNFWEQQCKINSMRKLRADKFCRLHVSAESFSSSQILA